MHGVRRVGASLYPRRSWEELGGMFLGRLAYLDGKPRGDKSMPGKRRSSGGVQGGVSRGPHDMVKLRREALCRIPDGVGRNSEGCS